MLEHPSYPFWFNLVQFNPAARTKTVISGVTFGHFSSSDLSPEDPIPNSNNDDETSDVERMDILQGFSSLSSMVFYVFELILRINTI